MLRLQRKMILFFFKMHIKRLHGNSLTVEPRAAGRDGPLFYTSGTRIDISHTHHSISCCPQKRKNTTWNKSVLWLLLYCYFCVASIRLLTALKHTVIPDGKPPKSLTTWWRWYYWGLTAGSSGISTVIPRMAAGGLMSFWAFPVVGSAVRHLKTQLLTGSPVVPPINVSGGVHLKKTLSKALTVKQRNED